MSSDDGKARSPFIVGPLYDGIFFVGTPLLALGLGVLISVSHFNDLTRDSELVSNALIGVVIHAHLVAVFFRSHGNRSIRKLHPFRFFAAPAVLFVAMLKSQWVMVSVSVLATFWDVYHSGLQTFGLGRIYNLKAGNQPEVGRRLDWWLNHLLYAGPILAGATLLDHVNDLREFEDVGSTFFSVVPVFLNDNRRFSAWALVVGGSVFASVYVYRYHQWHKRGYSVSVPKVALLVSTAACSIYSWGFNSWGKAFFIMNLFHAVQYFALVWTKERGNLTRLFRATRRPQVLSLALFLCICMGYGALMESPFTLWGLAYPLSLVVSIMHFWYDGFIWSVQKRLV